MIENKLKVILVCFFILIALIILLTKVSSFFYKNNINYGSLRLEKVNHSLELVVGD
ncbi:hypothetical protein GOQ27_09045 [Clostridium sp. D2Q-11]|uniref:Uncharacterized protein n=1 Tax=Anaeromonas frigoriresistens TaxID=2683708 RepID=A0A942UXH0_9FIRM|nr:hypothetical protein [Anaeromonas frigoriresistens]MBS4538609.1 hypothetical protein [Anaeromonas frigoriresistens]